MAYIAITIFAFIPVLPIIIVAQNGSKLMNLFENKNFCNDTFSDLTISKVRKYFWNKQCFKEDYFQKKDKHVRNVEEVYKYGKNVVIALFTHFIVGILFLCATVCLILTLFEVMPNWFELSGSRIIPFALFYALMFFIFYAQPIFENFLGWYKLSKNIVKFFQTLVSLAIAAVGFAVFIAYIAKIVNVFSNTTIYIDNNAFQIDLIVYVLAILLYHYIIAKCIVNKFLIFLTYNFIFKEIRQEHLIKNLLSNDTYLYMVIFYFIATLISAESADMIVAIGISFLIMTYFDNRKKIIEEDSEIVAWDGKEKKI
ncbi:MAG: hypothetical protein FWG63_02875 [Defluviitaleaceae bacterium]|nr:hypothetical protein [Defluviitaleaceae bacterium]